MTTTTGCGSAPARASDGRLVQPLSRLGEHLIDHPVQRLLLRVAFQEPQAVEVELAVRAGSLPDDGQRPAQLGLAAERAGVRRKRVDQRGRMVVDIHPAAAGAVAEKPCTP